MMNSTDLSEIIQATGEYVVACVDENAETNSGDWDWPISDMWTNYIGDCLGNENYESHEVIGPLQKLSNDDLEAVKDAVYDRLIDVQEERLS
jgi:hypothetical protein